MPTAPSGLKNARPWSNISIRQSRIFALWIQPHPPGKTDGLIALFRLSLLVFLMLLPLLLILAQQPKPLLDLGSGPKAPEPGVGTAVNALAEDMRRQADDLGHHPNAPPRDQARAAARSFIRQLAATGE